MLADGLGAAMIDLGELGEKGFDRGDEIFVVGIFLSNPTSEIDHFGPELGAGLPSGPPLIELGPKGQAAINSADIAA
jgi:hypothetical protein